MYADINIVRDVSRFFCAVVDELEIPVRRDLGDSFFWIFSSALFDGRYRFFVEIVSRFLSVVFKSCVASSRTLLDAAQLLGANGRTAVLLGILGRFFSRFYRGLEIQNVNSLPLFALFCCNVFLMADPRTPWKVLLFAFAKQHQPDTDEVES